MASPTAAGSSFFARRLPGDVLVAEISGRPVGYAHLASHSSMPSNSHVLHLNAIVVDSRSRGAGVGGALVTACIEEARRRGNRKLGLRVLGSNRAAIRLYESAGFELEGRLRGEFQLPGGGYEDDLWFGLPLTG